MLGTEIQVPQRPGVANNPIDINQDVFIVESRNNERERRRELLEGRQRMDLEVDLISIDRYVSELSEQLNIVDPMRAEFLKSLTMPILVSLLEQLS
jgi:hypothetical protein